MNVIMGGADAFDAVLYPEQSAANQSYIAQQLTQFSNTISDAGRAFLDSARQAYEHAYSEAAFYRAQLAIRAAGMALHSNYIMPLTDLTQLQQASPVMQRWIMAEPELRTRYNRQTCAGFTELYQDIHPKTVGDTHYDYRRVMNGLVVETDDGWTVSMYPDELLDGDRELNHLEQLDILATWDAIRYFMHQGRDPSDPDNGSL